MNYDDLSAERQRFIDALKYMGKELCIEVSDALIESETWQQFRERTFIILDEEHRELNVLKEQVVRI